jgi:hypothetical protein
LEKDKKKFRIREIEFLSFWLLEYFRPMLDIAPDEGYVPAGMVIHEMLNQFLLLSTKLCIFLDSFLSLT